MPPHPTGQLSSHSSHSHPDQLQAQGAGVKRSLQHAAPSRTCTFPVLLFFRLATSHLRRARRTRQPGGRGEGRGGRRAQQERSKAACLTATWRMCAGTTSDEMFYNRTLADWRATAAYVPSADSGGHNLDYIMVESWCAPEHCTSRPRPRRHSIKLHSPAKRCASAVDAHQPCAAGPPRSARPPYDEAVCRCASPQCVDTSPRGHVALMCCVCRNKAVLTMLCAPTMPPTPFAHLRLRAAALSLCPRGMTCL